jgi:hypothetical protein
VIPKEMADDTRQIRFLTRAALFWLDVNGARVAPSGEDKRLLVRDILDLSSMQWRAGAHQPPLAIHGKCAREAACCTALSTGPTRQLSHP